MKTLTMIARHGIDKDNINGYTLMTSDYQTETCSVKDLVAKMNKGLAVTNLAVEGGKIVSTNGALDKYTLFNSQTGEIIGTPKAVIIDRVEQNGKLVGYTVFMQNGTLAELSVLDAATLADKKLISNGKIKHTAEGDIVSAIGGTYPLRTINIDKAPKGEITADILYFSSVVGAGIEYAGAIISCTSATEMSKLIDVINKSNAKVVSTVVKVAGNSARESLAIKRMGANSVYAIVETSVIEKLVKANASIKNSVGKIIVSSIKYTDGEADEATITLNKEMKVVADGTADSKAANSAKNYAKKIVNAFGGVTIK